MAYNQFFSPLYTLVLIESSLFNVYCFLLFPFLHKFCLYIHAGVVCGQALQMMGMILVLVIGVVKTSIY